MWRKLIDDYRLQYLNDFKCMFDPGRMLFYLQYLKQETKIVDSFSPPQLPSHSDSIFNIKLVLQFLVPPHLKSCISDSKRYH